MPEVPLTYTSDMADIKRQLSQLSGMTESEVKKQLASFDRLNKAHLKQIKAEEKAQKQMMRNATREAQKLSGGAAKAKEGVAELASALSVVSPEAGAAAGQISALSGALKLAATGGPIAVAAIGVLTTTLGVGYLAYKAYNEEAERAERISTMVAAAEEARIPIVEALKDATLDLAVATGEMTKEARAMFDISASALDRYNKATDESRKKIAELKDEQAGISTQLVDIAEKVLPSWTVYGAAVRGLTKNTAEYQEEVDALNAEVETAIDLTSKQVTKARAAASARTGQALATRALAEAERDAAAAIRERQAADRTARNELIAGERAKEEAHTQLAALANERMDPETRLRQEYEDQLALILHLEDATGNVAMSERAQYNAWVGYAERRLELLDEEEKKKEALAASEQRRIEAEGALREEMMADFAGGIGTLGSSLDGLSSAMVDLNEKNMSAAKGLFAVSKGIAIAEATINAALAITSIWSKYAAYPPVAIGLTAIAAAATGAEIATIAATQPTFADTPGPVRAAQVGSTMTFSSQDTVIAARNPADLARQADQAQGRWAASRSGGPSVAVVEAHQHYGRSNRDAMRSPGAWREVQRQTGRTPGRRS